MSAWASLGGEVLALGLEALEELREDLEEADEAPLRLGFV